jgi:predicted CXXCH cytochrome family protein
MPVTRNSLLKRFIAIAVLGSMLSLDRHATGQDQMPPAAPLDPKAWGGNHAGKPVPEFVQGDECLFCHRNTIGVTWQKNAHGAAIRHREDAPELVKLLEGTPLPGDVAKQVEYFLGSRHRVRFLKKDGFGKFALLNAQLMLGEPAKLSDAERPAWDRDKFANRCAGCHTTGVDPATKAFSAFGHDCYACHGDVTLEHTNDTALILLSKKRRNDAKVITSLCAQCHLREGKSSSTGLPYPNNFIAGDNLFQDFAVDWARAEDAKLNAGDRHIWRNVREVAIAGNETITCLSCHQVHGGTGSFKHRRVLRAPLCAECHAADSFKNPKPYTVQSALCEY